MRQNMKIITIVVGLVALFLLQAGPSEAMPPSAMHPRLDNSSNGGPSLSPELSTMDMITHDQGNIITTVDNFGYIGGHQFYGYPSGEWPRNRHCAEAVPRT